MKFTSRELFIWLFVLNKKCSCLVNVVPLKFELNSFDYSFLVQHKNFLSWNLSFDMVWKKYITFMRAYHQYYSKTCHKRPHKKKTKIGFQDRLLLNAGQKYCRMLRGEHSALLSTFIKLPFVIKIFVLSIFEWPFYKGFTIFVSQKIDFVLAESEDPDKMPCSAAFHLGLLCLQKYPFEPRHKISNNVVCATSRLRQVLLYIKFPGSKHYEPW